MALYSRCAQTIAIAALALLGFASAEAQDSSHSSNLQPVSIEIGMLSAGGNVVGRMFEGGDPLFGGDWILREIESFKAAHSHIDVQTVAIEKPSRFAHPIESTPDLARNIIGIDSWTGYDTAYLADQELIRPIEDFLPDPEFDLDIFPANVWDAVTYDGKRWGIPWAIDSVVLVCNWPMFEAAGIEAPPATWDEFLDCAARLTRDTNGDGAADQWGFREHEIVMLTYIWSTIVLQSGGQFVSAAGVDTEHPAHREAFAFIQRLKGSGIVKTDPIGTDSSERCGMQILPANQVHAIMHKRHFRIAPLPTNGANVFPSLGRLYVAIRRSTPEQERASWEFIKWISRADVSMPRALGRIPARADFAGRADFRTRASSGPMGLHVLYESAAHSVDYGPHLRGRFNAFFAWYGAVSEAIKGNVTLDQALAAAKLRTGTLITALTPEKESFELFK